VIKLAAISRFGNAARRSPAPLPALPQPWPAHHRQWLEQVASYDDSAGEDAFLGRYDFTDVTPHRIYSSLLARLPESALAAAMPDDYSPREHVRQVLRSAEFQHHLIERVLGAFPEKRRLLFVHVPKCAGSDLASHLMRAHPYMGQMDQESIFVPAEKLLWRLQLLMSALAGRDTIAVLGHIGLSWLLSRQLVRHDDAVFSIVREPLEMAISKVNFVMTLLLSQQADPPPYLQAWMRQLGLERVPDALSEADARRYAIQLLQDPMVVPPDNLCRFLGRGDAESALDLCASSNIELTTVTRYPQWLQQRWGIASTTRLNESRKFVTRADLSASELDYLHGITQQDRLFYQRVESRLASSGRISVLGTQL
jgi:hypothetical protein